MPSPHAVDLCLVTALDGVFLEPNQNVSVEADRNGLLQRTRESASASVNPVLRGRLRYVGRVDRFIRQFREVTSYSISDGLKAFSAIGSMA
jgi:hypothetical protein